jgi:hypothetical protein
LAEILPLEEEDFKKRIIKTRELVENLKQL